MSYDLHSDVMEAIRETEAHLLVERDVRSEGLSERLALILRNQVVILRALGRFTS